MQTSADKKLHGLRISQLQNYWQKICEDEKRSQRRNEQLLRDLDRVEEHAARLAERSDTLRNLELEYRTYIEKMYPNWKERVLYQRQQRMRRNVQESADGHFLPDTQIHKQMEPNHVQHQSYTPQHYSSQSAKHISREESFTKQQSISVEKHLESPGISQAQHRRYENNERFEPDQLEVVDEEIDRFYRPSSEVSHGISSGLIGNAQENNACGERMAVAPNNRRASNSSSAPRDLLDEKSKSSYIGIDCTKNMMPSASDNPAIRMLESDPDSVTSLQRPDSPDSIPSKSEKDDFQTTKKSLSSNLPRKEQESIGLENKTHKNDIKTKGTAVGHSEENVPQNVNVSNSNELETRHRLPSAPLPDVSFKGFCLLLSSVEDEVAFGSTFKFYFQSTTPPISVVQEIIQAANGSDSLSHLNCESVAMVILEQLPCFSWNSENSCILTDNVVSSLDGNIGNKNLRGHLNPSDHLLWDSLYNHFIVLLRYEVLTPAEIADVFALSLIAQNSKKQRQAVAFLTKLLETVPPEEIHIPTPNSTSNFSFLTPRKPNESSQPFPDNNQLQNNTSARSLNEKVLEKGIAESPPLSPVYGLDLETNVHRSSLREPQGTLTQSAAYKQLLASTITSHTLNGLESDGDDDDDDDDEIEKNLSLHVAESRHSPQKNNKDISGFLSPRSPDSKNLPKTKLNSDQTKLADNNFVTEESETKNSFALKSASIKSERSAIESIISRIQDDFDVDDDNINDGLSKGHTAVKREDDDDDFWA